MVPGDPTEELLYQGRAQQADLIVLGAHGASAFAAIARQGVVYKVLAHSHCPVITLSPAVLADCGVKFDKEHRAEVFLAGVFKACSGITGTSPVARAGRVFGTESGIRPAMPARRRSVPHPVNFPFQDVLFGLPDATKASSAIACMEFRHRVLR